MIKRARLRVEILKAESNQYAKYELFQRLNTGGMELSEQEVRNCVAIMLNIRFYEWLKGLSENANFLATIDQTEDAIKKGIAMELALRFIVFRNVPYSRGLDVHDYLKESLIELCTRDAFDFENEGTIFIDTFTILNTALGARTFKKWDGTGFRGKFLMSLFEVMAIGLSKALHTIIRLDATDRQRYLEERAKSIWDQQEFITNSGSGVRGTTRLIHLIPFSDTFFN